MPDVNKIFGPTRRINYSLSKIKREDELEVEDPFSLKRSEETVYAKNYPIAYQFGYVDRLLTLEASRKIVNKVFDFKSVKKGVEFGCGIFGWLYNYLLPDGIDWKQFDINPKAVEFNKKYTRIFGKIPDISVGDLYEMPLKDSSVEVIAGLSCWDSIYFFEDAAKEVDRCLEPGGFFIHFQDLHPCDKPLILTEAKKRIKKGLNSNVPVDVHDQRVILGEDGLECSYIIISIDSVDFGQVRLGEYLTKHLANLFKDKGYKTHIAEEKRSEAIIRKDKVKQLLKKHEFLREPKLDAYEKILDHNVRNCVLSAYGKTILDQDPSISEDYIKQQSFMDVLVAQKPE